MFFKDLYSQNKKTLTFEFFPPRKEEFLNNTFALVEELSKCNPDFMTVTYGAGGGTRDLTKKIVSFIHSDLGVPAVAHLTCVGHSIEEIDLVLDSLKAEGVSNILALRGDPPKGENKFIPHPQGFSCARDLIRHIAKRGDFSIAAAGYPETHAEAESPEADIAYLKEKCDEGAEIVLTQLFFESSMYFDFVERAESAGITAAIVPGIMPIASVKQIKKITSMCAATIPSPMLTDLEKIEGDTDAVIQYGIDYCIRLCDELLAGGAPGIHLYTLNKSTQTKPIVEALSI